MTRKGLEATSWAASFRREAPVSYPLALHYAGQDELEAFIDYTDENGSWAWIIRVAEDPGFWMDVKDSRDEAVALCRQMKWLIIE